LKQKNAAKAKKHNEMDKKHQPQLYWKNMGTIPHHSIIPTQTIQRQQQKNNLLNRKKLKNPKRKTIHHPT